MTNLALKESNVAPNYWNMLMESPLLITPLPLNWLACAMFSYQASSATTERMFSDKEIGRMLTPIAAFPNVGNAGDRAIVLENRT